MKKGIVAVLLSFNGGFLDTAGFLGLQGLFTAHVTGNFVTLGAALVFGTHGVLGKLLALPEFVIVIAMARLAGAALTARQLPTLQILLGVKVLFLAAFFVLAVALGPFSDSDVPAALVTGFAGIAAMAIQNEVQHVHLASIAPTTLMTGNTTQATLDSIDLLRSVEGERNTVVHARFSATVRGNSSLPLGARSPPSSTLGWLLVSCTPGRCGRGKCHRTYRGLRLTTGIGLSGIIDAPGGRGRDSAVLQK
jgi:uncharacterized membrane protein YoaK (UPF0700 family)